MISRAILLAALLVAGLAATAEAQRPGSSTSRSAPAKTSATASTTTPLEYATSLRRGGRSADQAAAGLVERYRQGSVEVAATLLRSGYEPGPVGRALVGEMKESPRVAAGHLERAGVRDPHVLYAALLGMSRTRPDALKFMKSMKGSRVAIDVFLEGGGEEPPTAEEAAREMDDTGFSLQEIFDALAGDPYGLSAEDILALFLELNLADTGEVLNPAGAIVQSVLSLHDIVQFLLDQGVSAAEIAGALFDQGYSAEEVAEILREAGAASLEEIVQILVDAGVSAPEIAEILTGMQVSLAKRLELLTTIAGLTQDAAMAIISNLQ